MTNVIPFNGVTRLDLDPERVLESARDQLTGVVIMGYTRDGSEYFASSYADGGDVLWLLERLKLKLLTSGTGE